MKKIILISMLTAILLFSAGESSNNSKTTPESTKSNENVIQKEVDEVTKAVNEVLDNDVKTTDDARKQNSKKDNKNEQTTTEEEKKEDIESIINESLQNQNLETLDGETLEDLGQTNATDIKDEKSGKVTIKQPKIDPKKPIIQAKDKEVIDRDKKYDGELIKYVATKSGYVIEESRAKEIHPLASITKVMNVLVALDAVDSGRVSLDDKLCFDYKTANIGGSWLNVKEGECFSLEDLLRSELVYSANNSAYLVANYIYKEDDFIKAMNRKAKELNMRSTTFYTPAGLPTSMTGRQADMSTAYDIYLMTAHAIKDERIRKWASEKAIILENFRGVQVLYNNRNPLLGEYGIYGLKTGFHNKAGYNITVASQQSNLDIISVVLGAKSGNERASVSRAVFQNIEKLKKVIYKKGEVLGKVKVRYGKQKQVGAQLGVDIYELDGEKYEYEVVQETKVNAKVEKGDVVGTLLVKLNGEVISKIDLYAENDIEELNWFMKIIRFITFGLV